MCAAYKNRHDYFVSALNSIEGLECRPGEGTFYAFPSVHGALSALELDTVIALVERLLEREGLACVPGSAFGAAGYLRLSFACSMEQLEEASVRLKRALLT
jgi:aspartate aminotransferase